MKMMDRMQAKIDEIENKMELMATMFQTLIKGTSRKDGEGPYNEWKI